jgi:glutathione S-transferase
MLKLHGLPISNFYCIAKQALLEKGLAFEEVYAVPSQEPAFLAISPMGKVPALECAAGVLTETSVILEYLEDAQPAPALYPADPFQRARARQLIKTVELYIEAPAHTLIGAVFGGELSPAQRDSVKPMLQRGLAALRRLADFSPWLAGDSFGAADIFAYHSLALAALIGGKVYDWDVLAEVPGLQDWMALMAERPITRQLGAESQAALAAYLQQRA